MNKYPATWYQRFAAFWIDQFIIGAFVMMTLIILSAFGNADQEGSVVLSILLLIGLLISIASPVFFVLRKGRGHGQTYGKTVMGIRAVRDDGRAWTPGKVLLREIVFKGILFAVLLIFIPLVIVFMIVELVYMVRNPGKSYHDRWSKSHVISEKKPQWKPRW